MARHQHLFPPAYPNSSSDCTWLLFCSFSVSFNTLALRGLHRVPITNLKTEKKLSRLCSCHCTQSTRAAHCSSGSTPLLGRGFWTCFWNLSLDQPALKNLLQHLNVATQNIPALIFAWSKLFPLCSSSSLPAQLLQIRSPLSAMDLLLESTMPFTKSSIHVNVKYHAYVELNREIKNGAHTEKKCGQKCSME